MNKNEMSSFKSIERKIVSSVHKTSFLIFLVPYAESMQSLWNNVYNFSPWDFLEVIIFWENYIPLGTYLIGGERGLEFFWLSVR